MKFKFLTLLLVLCIVCEYVSWKIIQSKLLKRIHVLHPKLTMVTSYKICHKKLDENGNTGNQLFEISAAYCTSLKNSNYLKFYLPNSCQKLPIFNWFSNLNKFLIPDILPTKEIYEMDFYSEINIPLDGGIYAIRGMRQDWRYVIDYQTELKQLFDIKLDIQLPDKFIALHVRRGDYLKLQYHFAKCSNQYYQNALQIIYAQDPTSINYPIIICSNDRDYALQLASLLSPLAVVSNINNNSMMDFYTMMKAQHLIIANSTFSFWAAFLSQQENSIVVSPSEYGNQKDFRTMLIRNRSIVLQHWYTLHPNTGEIAIPSDALGCFPFLNTARCYYMLRH